MAWWAWTLLGIYGLGFGFAFWFNTQLGMITFGLILLRSFFWPLWLMGLIPGERQRMD